MHDWLVLPIALLMAGMPAIGAVAASPSPSPTGKAHAPVTVEGAYVPEGPPTAKVMAAYLTLVNPTARAAVLTGATSPDFGKVEVHQTVKQDGVARMMKADRVLIPAKGQTAFVPGGYHVMLFRPQRAFKAGDAITLQLHIQGAQAISVTVPVIKRPAQRHDHHHH